MTHQQDNWEWAQYDHYEALTCQLTDDEQAALISTQKALNSRLDMTFDELIASMQSGDMKQKAIKQTEKES